MRSETRDDFGGGWPGIEGNTGCLLLVVWWHLLFLLVTGIHGIIEFSIWYVMHRRRASDDRKGEINTVLIPLTSIRFVFTSIPFNLHSVIGVHQPFHNHSVSIVPPKVEDLLRQPTL